MSLVVVLHRPQDLVNIAGVIRVMKNFDLRDLRLVAPVEYDAYRVEGIAHQTGDVLKRVQLFDALDPALADCHHVVGFTARQRTAKRNVQRPREAAAEILAASGEALVALLFGPEDKGLTNDELDRCHRILTIPTTPAYASLNLAQAVSVMAYELFLARGTPPFKPPRRSADPATQEQLERLFADARRALEAIDFFKTRNPEPIMRTVREVIHRTPFDAREVELARAMCIELTKAVRDGRRR
ncbi:MAG: TrmJ/YjtD family RNA methyltransferase [Gemmatimonadetes bacterium]|nr:TrmJ/YjtD family RNA methyltransferase [Gemmatimonadota bacterium]